MVKIKKLPLVFSIVVAVFLPSLALTAQQKDSGSEVDIKLILESLESSFTKEERENREYKEYSAQKREREKEAKDIERKIKETIDSFISKALSMAGVTGKNVDAVVNKERALVSDFFVIGYEASGNTSGIAKNVALLDKENAKKLVSAWKLKAIYAGFISESEVVASEGGSFSIRKSSVSPDFDVFYVPSEKSSVSNVFQLKIGKDYQEDFFLLTNKGNIFRIIKNTLSQ
ncbi:MAG: hypothetical protein DDT22_01148 [candidate division WS2 bacterium]|nr:hypothetical protein [Candidatus Lithacetigena glycinireducens]